MYDMADREEAANSSAVNSTSHDDRWGGWDAGFSEAGFAIAGDTKCLIKKKKKKSWLLIVLKFWSADLP